MYLCGVMSDGVPFSTPILFHVKLPVEWSWSGNPSFCEQSKPESVKGKGEQLLQH